MTGVAGDVLDALERQANADSARLLYSFLDGEGRELERHSRESLIDRVQLLSGHLLAIPRIVQGDRLLVAYPPGLEMICAFFACAWSGLIPVPVAAPMRSNMQSSLARMAAIALDCQPAALLTDSATAALLEELPQDKSSLHPTPPLGGLPRIRTDLLVSRAGNAGDRRRHNRILFLQYTSGSTRQAKGVIVTHDNILANAGLTIDHADAIGVSWLPQHHDMGLIGYYINGAVAGGTLHGFSPAAFVRRPELWLETISRFRATATSAPNFALEHCLKRIAPQLREQDGLDLSSLKFLMAAAEPIKPDVYRQFLQTFAPFGLRPEALIVAYGLAENTLAVSSYGRRTLSLSRRALAEGKVRVSNRAADVSSAQHVMSCGRPLSGNEILIVDPANRKPLPERDVGEIWVAGPSKCAGYWGDPAGSAETFMASIGGRHASSARRYLRTGDLGFLHDGELYVCGRLKDLIIIRGQNYHPQDIEAAIERRCAGVRRGGLAAFETDHEGEAQLVLMVEPESPKAHPELSRIAEVVRYEIGLVPDEILLVAPRSIPRTSSGKIRRYLARDLLAQQRIEVLARRTMYRSGSAASSNLPPGPFASVRHRYGLTGKERCSLSDAGVDSLDLVLTLHELIELFAAAGAGKVAERLDIRTVQERSIAELFGLAARLETSPATALAQLRQLVSTQGRNGPAFDVRWMQQDLGCWSPPTLDRLQPQPEVDNESILLTGATGFLGPFLLSSLLSQTRSRIYALVRAKSDDEAQMRLRSHLNAVATPDREFWHEFDNRVLVLSGDLERPRLALDPHRWSELAEEVGAIHHNGAVVNYLMTYDRMRRANVLGTREVLRLATRRRLKTVNHISTTFVFGWADKPVLLEDHDDIEMELLDFGYSQSKWVAEQLLLSARRSGVPVRIFRPSLVGPSLPGRAVSCDISLRLLAFMIKHGIGTSAKNQLSLLPADVAAANMVAITQSADTLGQIFHVTRNGRTTVADALQSVTRLTGRTFELYDLKAFVPEVIRRCTREDPLYPLLDFLIRSVDKISSMAFKRYDNTNYRRACEAIAASQAEPSLDATMIAVLLYLKNAGLTDIAIGER